MSSEVVVRLRIKLEGRLEVVEAALPRYRDFERVLVGNWRRRAIEARAEVLTFCAADAAVDEALAQLQRFTDEDRGPVNALIAQLDAYRKELAGRVGAASWPEARNTLRATAESVKLPGPDEVVVLYGTAERKVPMWAVVVPPALLAFVMLGPIAAVGVAVSMVCLALAVIPLGRYAVLADRVLWLPHAGVPKQLPVASLKQIDLKGRGIALASERDALTLPAVDSATGMAAVLLLYRDGPLKGVDRPPAGTSLVLPAVLASGATAEGTALLHPGGLFFLAKGQAAEVLRRMVGRAELDVSERFVLEQLSRLDPADLAPLLASFAGLACVNAPADQVIADPIRGGKLRLRVRMSTLIDLALTGVDSVALATLLPWTKAA